MLHGVIDELVRERFAPMRAEPPVLLSVSMREALRNERARSRLALGAAAIALLLTIVGLYASVQHMVDARRAELAVRKAIGATDGRLVRMILGRAGAIVTLGCCSALLIALLFSRASGEVPARAECVVGFGLGDDAARRCGYGPRGRIPAGDACGASRSGRRIALRLKQLITAVRFPRP